MNFDILDAILKKKHMSRRALALAVGINENKMSSAYKRRSGLSSADVLKIADYLGVSPYELEGWTNDEQATDLSTDEAIQVIGNEDAEALLRLAAYDEKYRKGQRSADKSDSSRRGRLAAAYDKLNDLGQTEAVKRVEELSEIPRYTVSEEE